MFNSLCKKVGFCFIAEGNRESYRERIASIQLKLIRVFKVNKILYHNNSSSIFLSLLLCSFVLRRWIVGAHFSFDMKSGFLLLCVISFFQLQTCLGYYPYQLLLAEAFALSLSFISYSCKRKKNAWLVLKAVNV